MRDDLKPGAHVKTVKPAVESGDWAEDAKKLRRWGANGYVVDRSDRHGVVYKVEHEDDKTTAWYERRELQQLDVYEYTYEERKEMIAKMQALSDMFYGRATQAGVHAFIEFAGLMNEFIKVCYEANEKGIPFEFANTHTGKEIPFQPWNLAYLAEKLNCIYGPALLSNERNRTAFIQTLFDGEFRLVPVEGQ